MREPPARVLRHESEHGSWELVLRPPDQRLRAFVGEYEGYVESGSPSTVLRQQVPTTSLPLIVNFGSPWRVADSANGSTGVRLHDSFFAGLHESSSFVAASGPASCVQVNFTPLAAHMLLGIPMYELSNRIVDLRDVLPTTARNLTEQLASAQTWEDRFALLDAVFAAELSDAPKPSPEVVWAWHTLVQTRGRVRVGTLAELVGRSRRHLIARFHEQVGLPPKTVGRILRFDRAVELLRQRDVGFAELAFECGYYDQSHLNRDFREFAATSPGEFARRIVQDGGVVA